MTKIKRKPVFEKINDTWQLMTSDCPVCLDGDMMHIGSIDSHHKNERRYYACDECGIVITYYPYASDAKWRILQ